MWKLGSIVSETTVANGSRESWGDGSHMQLMAGICKWNKDWRTDADATSVGHFTVPVIDRTSLLRHLGRVTSGDRCPNPALLIQTDL